MIPDNVEKIIMTKEDYDRNVEQLLYDKINAEQEVERLNNIIKEAIEFIYENAYDEKRKYCIDDLWDEIPKLLEILNKGE